jgi:hypothetical protein
LFIVEGMDVCSLLEVQVGRSCREPIPDRWGDSSALLDAGSVGALIGVIRRLDNRSDRVLLALLEGGARGDPLCTAVIVAALVPLVLARCRGDRDRVDDYVAELALVIATVDVEALHRSRRRVGGVLLDRAWDEIRRPFRRPSPVAPMDPTLLSVSQLDESRSVEDEALGQLAFPEAEAVVRRVGVQRPWVAAAWVSALELAERVDRDAVEARRWKYVRVVLQRHVAPELVA